MDTTQEYTALLHEFKDKVVDITNMDEIAINTLNQRIKKISPNKTIQKKTRGNIDYYFVSYNLPEKKIIYVYKKKSTPLSLEEQKIANKIEVFYEESDIPVTLKEFTSNVLSELRNVTAIIGGTYTPEVPKPQQTLFSFMATIEDTKQRYEELKKEYHQTTDDHRKEQILDEKERLQFFVNNELKIKSGEDYIQYLKDTAGFKWKQYFRGEDILNKIIVFHENHIKIKKGGRIIL